MSTTRLLLRFSTVTALVAGGFWLWSAAPPDSVDAPVATATASPQSPWQESDLWLAPAESTTTSDLARGVSLVDAGRAADALPLLTPSLSDPVLGPYARLHLGRAQLSLRAPERAAAAAREVMATNPSGHLGESAGWLLAVSLEEADRWPEAVAAWQSLAASAPATPALVFLRLGQAADKAGSGVVAREAYTRIHYDWPASAEAEAADAALARVGFAAGSGPMEREVARARALYAARRYSAARDAYSRVLPRVRGDDRDLAVLRLAQCDVHLQRYQRGLEGLDAYLKSGAAANRVEAAYSRLAAWRGLRRADYPARVDQFVAEYPSSVLAETALNELATHHILANDDAAAAAVFTTMYARYPSGSYADRAAWRAGWWAYRAGNLRETIRLFESAATSLSRADYRPSWLYWTGRSYERLKQHDTARLWYLRTIADYRNSYYGRIAMRALTTLPGGGWTAADIVPLRDPARAVVAGVAPAGTALAQRLLAAGLWDDAIAELRRVQAAAGRATPVIEATIAFALNRKGDLRPAITAMRRAYPQFMSDGGEHLPERMLKVIFPVAHDDLIARYARERSLDRYLVTALVAQESTFQADVRSAANAWGLMQLLPSTGRRYASRLGVKPFSTGRLTEPETNVRLGTAYLADLLDQFGDAAPALAAYNAGENRVERWQAERRGVPRDEFIDDIPFPETQNYVKRILGTAEDYRILYGAPTTAGDGGR